MSRASPTALVCVSRTLYVRTRIWWLYDGNISS